MKIYGITGTNGKTTTTWILDALLGGGGYVTTVEVNTGRRRFSTGYTTPPLPVLKEIFAEMESAGCATCVMEVSSHAIHQRRTGDTVFAGGGFTNLTEDHLDYHKTMEAYFQVKADFFRRLAESTPGAPAAICVDGDYGRRLADICRALPLRTIECGLSVGGGIKDVDGALALMDLNDLRDLIAKRCPLVGRYNVQNVLLAAALALGAGVRIGDIIAKIPFLTPRWGRLERVATRSAADVFVDYAHTDDALANVLSTVREFTKGKVWAVFGAGGDRDRAKRPLMGAAAAAHADRLVVTSDNPRSEDPQSIIGQIVAGIPAGKDFVTEPDRAKAIHYALSLAEAGDTVVVCGKGHETTQTIGDKVIHFDDRETCAQF
ncbi:MAG: UDP-N-acetylmuramoyl-L-alanyl-D-glutamate--2,6-diaminopimelate ligase [Kiritimatiellae bacterium]|nr:UDP-N-acetylmuramoyl-L-alanyl-D-glutamate--2,6-diaminopimelate ligase [Kiritimatiellia bacterium]